MLQLVLHNLHVIVIAIAVLTLVELIINFKHPVFLKLMLVLITVAIIFNGIAVIYYLNYGYNRWLFELPRVVFGAAGFNFFTYIYNQRTKKYFILLGCFIVSLQLVALVYFSFIHHIDEHINLITVEKYSLPKRLIRIFFATIMIGIAVDIYTKILKKYKSDNIYFAEMRKWSLYAVIGISICYLSNVVLLFNATFISSSLLLKGLADLTCLLFILFRPKFLNNTHLKITLSETFNFKSLSEINPDTFAKHFYANYYYLDRDANINTLSHQLQITTEALKEFIEMRYQMTFIDLVNKHRVDYFVDMLNTGKFHHLTLDALAQKSGFNTRQNLTKAFKKFHGGTPSELMRAIVAD